MIGRVLKIPRGVCFIVLLFLLIKSPLARSQTAHVFLNPDTTYITTGNGTIFTLNVEVDANTDSLHSFRLNLDFNKDVFDACFYDTTNSNPDSLKIDTLYAVYAEEGSLMDTFPGSTFFVWELSPDSSSIFIGDAIMGANTYVYGPGVIAKVHFITKGSGISPLNFRDLVLKQSYYDTIPSTSTNGIAYINIPPSSFNLLSPADSTVIKTWQATSILLNWDDATTVYPGDSILYTLYYSTSQNFTPSLTDSIMNIKGSQYQLNLDTFTVPYSLIYWKVKAVNTYGFKTWCSPSHLRFAVLTPSPPSNFNLLYPPDSSAVAAYVDSIVTLDWQDALSAYPGDIILYILYYSTDKDFTPSLTDSVLNLNISQFGLPIDSFTLFPVMVYWKVRALDTYGFMTWCNPSYYRFLILNFKRGDANGDLKLTVADVVYLISFLFKGGPPPNPLIAGDANCDGKITVADAVYLVNYLFKGGPLPPC